MTTSADHADSLFKKSIEHFESADKALEKDRPGTTGIDKFNTNFYLILSELELSAPSPINILSRLDDAECLIPRDVLTGDPQWHWNAWFHTTKARALDLAGRHDEMLNYIE